MTKEPDEISQAIQREKSENDLAIIQRIFDQRLATIKTADALFSLLAHPDIKPHLASLKVVPGTAQVANQARKAGRPKGSKNSPSTAQNKKRAGRAVSNKTKELAATILKAVPAKPGKAGKKDILKAAKKPGLDPSKWTSAINYLISNDEITNVGGERAAALYQR